MPGISFDDVNLLHTRYLHSFSLALPFSDSNITMQSNPVGSVNIQEIRLSRRLKLLKIPFKTVQTYSILRLPDPSIFIRSNTVSQRT